MDSDSEQASGAAAAPRLGPHAAPGNRSNSISISRLKKCTSDLGTQHAELFTTAATLSSSSSSTADLASTLSCAAASGVTSQDAGPDLSRWSAPVQYSTPADDDGTAPSSSPRILMRRLSRLKSISYADKGNSAVTAGSRSAGRCSSAPDTTSGTFSSSSGRSESADSASKPAPEPAPEPGPEPAPASDNPAGNLPPFIISSQLKAALDTLGLTPHQLKQWDAVLGDPPGVASLDYKQDCLLAQHLAQLEARKLSDQLAKMGASYSSMQRQLEAEQLRTAELQELLSSAHEELKWSPVPRGSPPATTSLSAAVAYISRTMPCSTRAQQQLREDALAELTTALAAQQRSEQLLRAARLREQLLLEEVAALRLAYGDPLECQRLAIKTTAAALVTKELQKLEQLQKQYRLRLPRGWGRVVQQAVGPRKDFAEGYAEMWQQEHKDPALWQQTSQVLTELADGGHTYAKTVLEASKPAPQLLWVAAAAALEGSAPWAEAEAAIPVFWAQQGPPEPATSSGPAGNDTASNHSQISNCQGGAGSMCTQHPPPPAGGITAHGSGSAGAPALPLELPASGVQLFDAQLGSLAAGSSPSSGVDRTSCTATAAAAFVTELIPTGGSISAQLAIHGGSSPVGPGRSLRSSSSAAPWADHSSSSCGGSGGIRSSSTPTRGIASERQYATTDAAAPAAAAAAAAVGGGGPPVVKQPTLSSKAAPWHARVAGALCFTHSSTAADSHSDSHLSGASARIPREVCNASVQAGLSMQQDSMLREMVEEDIRNEMTSERAQRVAARLRQLLRKRWWWQEQLPDLTLVAGAGPQVPGTEPSSGSLLSRLSSSLPLPRTSSSNHPPGVAPALRRAEQRVRDARQRVRQWRRWRVEVTTAVHVQAAARVTPRSRAVPERRPVVEAVINPYAYGASDDDK